MGKRVIIDESAVGTKNERSFPSILSRNGRHQNLKASLYKTKTICARFSEEGFVTYKLFPWLSTVSDSLHQWNMISATAL